MGSTHTLPPAPFPRAAPPPDPLPTLRAERPTWAAARRAAPRVPWAAATKSSSVVWKGTPAGERGRSGWRLGCQARKGGASPHSAIYKKKKKTQVVQWAPEENQVREVPVAAGASSTTTASGIRLVREAGLAWRGPQHTLVPT